jgi:hypothetical protein
MHTHADGNILWTLPLRTVSVRSWNLTSSATAWCPRPSACARGFVGCRVLASAESFIYRSYDYSRFFVWLFKSVSRLQSFAFVETVGVYDPNSCKSWRHLFEKSAAR